MKIKLLAPTVVKAPAGTEIEIADERAALLISCGAAEPVKAKADKPEKKAKKK